MAIGDGCHVLFRDSSLSRQRKLNFSHTHTSLVVYHYMYHQAPDMDSDFVRAWTLIHELSEQLAHNQKMISTLASQAGLLQVRAILKPNTAFCAVWLNRIPLPVGRGWAVCGIGVQPTPIQHRHFQGYALCSLRTGSAVS